MRREKTLKKLFCGLMLLSLVLTGCVAVVDNTMPKVISVIAKGDSGSFWNAVLVGAEDAALENGYGITFRGPETDGMDGVDFQRGQLELAMENEASAILVAAIGPGLEDLLSQAKEKKIPVVQFDSGIFRQDLSLLKAKKTNPVIASVYTDNRKAAALNAGHLFFEIREEIAHSLTPYGIGIIQHDLSPSGEERAQGFLEAFQALADEDPATRGKYIIRMEVCRTEKDNAYGKALLRLAHQGVRAMFLTNQEVVNQVYDAVVAHPDQYDYLVFTGFDSGKKQVTWMRDLERPRLIGSVTQDAYALGYNGIMQCINGLEARGVTAFVEIPATWYDKDNLEEMLLKNLVFD